MLKISIIILALIIAGCAGMGKFYTGQSFYYNLNGIPFECREPEPYKGGNCKPASMWELPS